MAARGAVALVGGPDAVCLRPDWNTKDYDPLLFHRVCFLRCAPRCGHPANLVITSGGRVRGLITGRDQCVRLDVVEFEPNGSYRHRTFANGLDECCMGRPALENERRAVDVSDGIAYFSGAAIWRVPCRPRDLQCTKKKRRPGVPKTAYTMLPQQTVYMPWHMTLQSVPMTLCE